MVSSGGGRATQQVHVVRDALDVTECRSGPQGLTQMGGGLRGVLIGQRDEGEAEQHRTLVPLITMGPAERAAVGGQLRRALPVTLIQRRYGQ